MSAWRQEQFLHELRGLMRIPTEYDAQTVCEGMPCGEPIARGLAYIRDIALRDGFTVREYGGHALAILYGEQPRRVEAVSHVDVVPAGTGWSVPPYGAKVRQGRLYGRGAQDMKTALWLTYEALKKIRREGTPCKRQIRLVIGTDEERTMRDVAHYLSCDGLPDFAFTPDGGFPLCLGEKGDLVLYCEGNVQTRVRNLSGGSAANVVCETCRVTLTAEDMPAATALLSSLGWEYTVENAAEPTLCILGKAAHTSMPHLGDNAAVKALRLIDLLFHEPWAKQLLACFGDAYGAGFGLTGDYPPMGYASVGLNILRVADGRVHGEADIRFPTPLTAQSLTKQARATLPIFQVRNVYEELPVQTELANPYVQALLNNYRAHYPDGLSQPYFSGGVTYAKVYAGRCVAYGPRRLNDATPALAHQADEYTPVEPLEKLCNVYADALSAVSNCEG